MGEQVVFGWLLTCAFLKLISTKSLLDCQTNRQSFPYTTHHIHTLSLLNNYNLQTEIGRWKRREALVTINKDDTYREVLTDPVFGPIEDQTSTKSKMQICS
jgi:hypothetical protein